MWGEARWLKTSGGPAASAERNLPSLRMTILIDTNVVISAVTDRNDRQRERAEALFRAAAAGASGLALPQFVLFESCYVLRNLYGVAESTASEMLRELIRMPETTVIHELPLETWFAIWPSRIRQLADAALASLALDRRWEVATFDQQFARRLRSLGVEVWKS